MNRCLLFILPLALLPPSASAWVVVENDARRPIPLQEGGNVRSEDIPAAFRSAMSVDALSRTVEWRGDRGYLRASWGDRMIVKNGRARMLSRPVRFEELSVLLPEELLKDLADIFSFVEVAGGEELRVGEEPDVHSAKPPEASANPGRSRKVVVIDPGHGGGDPGAKGAAGAVEKDIVLAIAIEAALALRQMDPSIKVILTRSDDVFVSLPDRAKIANTRRGDLFVSIHANSVRRNSDASGFEVYHLDLDGANDDARALAAFENEASQQDPGHSATQDDQLKHILGDVMQVQYLNASLDLSKNVSDAMASALEGASKSRGSKGAFFYVLKDVMAPAILVEVGFVTNEWEASFLQKPWYQRKIAGAIAEGILNFKRMEEHRSGLEPAAADSPVLSSPAGE